MKKFKIFFFSLVMFSSEITFSQQSGWQLLNPNLNTNIWGMDFINATTGFIADDIKVYKTTDGGLNWKINFIHSRSYEDIQFVNNQTGYMGCFWDGSIAKTTNGGITWDTLPAVWYGISAIDFLDANTGYITAKYGPVVKTTNGGLNWASVTTIQGQSWDIDFINANTGLVMNDDGFKRTTDGGITWTDIYLESKIYSYQIKFIDENNVIALCYNNFTQYHGGAILKSTNGGINWTMKYDMSDCVGELELVGNTIFATGYGKIYKSTDTGNTWQTYNTVSTSDPWRIKFVNENTGYICGFNNLLMKTTNGGVDPNGIIQINSELPKSYSLSQNYPNPFNPTTRIKFEIPKASLVRLTVYDILGREVKRLVNQSLNAGSYAYEFDGAGLTSGIYFYKLEGGEYIETKRMVLVK